MMEGGPREQLEKTIGMALAFGAALCAQQLLKWWRNRREQQVRHPTLAKSTRVDAEITIVLHAALIRLGAQRVYFARYHNGNYFDEGSSIQRKSRTHEVCRPGVSYQSDAYHDNLLSALVEESKLVLAEGASWTPVSVIPHSHFRSLCEQGGTTSVARCAVRKAGRIVGFVGADFSQGEQKPPAIETLCDDAYTIGQILSSEKM